MSNKFPLELSSFKKVYEDNKSATLKHPDGHTIKIAKASLDDRRKKQLSTLPKYADGGAVLGNDDEEEADGFDKFFGLKGQKSPLTNESAFNSFIGVENPDAEQNLLAPDLTGGSSRVPANEPDEFAIPVSNATPSMVPASMSQSPASPELIPMLNQQPATPQAGFPVPAQAQQQAQRPTVQGVAQYQSALAGEAKAHAQLAKEQLHVEQDAAAQGKKIVDDYAFNSSTISKERDELIKRYEEGKIKPGRYLESKGTMSRIATAIGMLAGGLGGGLLGTENPAMKMLNDDINRDIESQKMDLGKVENLLTENMKKFGNLKDATTMSQAILSGVTASKMRQEALKIADPILKNQMLQKAAMFQMQYAPLLDKMAQTKTINDLFNSGQAINSKVINAMPEDIRERVVQIPNGPTLLSPSKEDATKVKGTIQSYGALHQQLKEMRNFMSETGRTVPYSDSSARANAMRSQMITTLKDFYSLGALSGGDMDLLDAQVPDPGGFNQGNNLAKMDELAKRIEEKYSAAVTAHLPGNKIATMGESSVPQEQQKFLSWARANPNDPRSQMVLKKLGVR